MDNDAEGFIKYRIHWKKKPVLRDILLDELIHYRNQLFDLKLIGAYPDGIGFGNLSQQIGNKGSYLITGTQSGHIPRLKPEQVSLVTKCSVAQNELFCEGPVKPSSEALTHGAFYAANAGIKAVIHVHQLAMWEDLLNILPSTAEGISYGTVEMAKAVQKIMADPVAYEKKIILMAGHREGIFVYGPSMPEAFAQLMHYAEAYLK